MGAAAFRIVRTAGLFTQKNLFFGIEIKISEIDVCFVCVKYLCLITPIFGAAIAKTPTSNFQAEYFFILSPLFIGLNVTI